MAELEAAYTRHTVNSGEVLIPSILTLENIERMGHVDVAPGLATGVREAIPELLRCIALDPANLAFALCDGGGERRQSWGHVMLARCSRGWQRVRIETSACGDCGWRGRVATPTVAELYYGTSDEDGEYRGAFNLARVACPRCNGKLPGRPIWVEPERASDPA